MRYGDMAIWWRNAVECEAYGRGVACAIWHGQGGGTDTFRQYETMLNNRFICFGVYVYTERKRCMAIVCVWVRTPKNHSRNPPPIFTTTHPPSDGCVTVWPNTRLWSPSTDQHRKPCCVWVFAIRLAGVVVIRDPCAFCNYSFEPTMWVRYAFDESLANCTVLDITSTVSKSTAVFPHNLDHQVFRWQHTS